MKGGSGVSRGRKGGRDGGGGRAASLKRSVGVSDSSFFYRHFAY